jgi:hypothetical protein
MKIIATSSVFNEPFNDVGNVYKDTLDTEQEKASDTQVRQALADWWSRYFDSEVPLNSTHDQLQTRIDAIEVDAQTLWDRAFTGWSNVFYQKFGPDTATIVLSADKTRMSGTVNPDANLQFSQLVSFEVLGTGLGLNDETYTINSFTLKYRVPHTDNTEFKVSFAGNMEFNNSLLNLDTLVLRQFDASAGGFINFGYKGNGTVKGQWVKTVHGDTARVNMLDLSNASFTFSLNNDPARNETPLFKFNVVGQFKEYFGSNANRVSVEPLQRLNEVNIQLGDLHLNLTNLNIRSTDSDNMVEDKLTNAILESLKRTGIDLGFSLNLGNGMKLDVDSARFIQSKTNPYAYSAKGIVMSASIDTQVGAEMVPFRIKAKLNASFDLKTGESLVHLTQLHLQSNPSNMVKQQYDILIDDILVPVDRFPDVDSSTIESLISTVTSVNQSRNKSTSLTYDDSINLSGMSSVVSVMLTGGLHANITGNGHNNVLTGNAGNNRLDGGTGRDQMAGGLGNDAYFVDNPGDKIFELSAGGSDIVNSSVSYNLGRNLENLRLTSSAALSGRGNDLNNAIYGSDSRNYLYGGAGNDQLDGGLGNDRLSGGPGEDKFIFSTPLNASTNLETITDFVSGQDQLILSPSVFAAWTPDQLLVGSDWELNQHSFKANDRLIFNTSTQTLSYDANGWGGRDGTPIAVLTGVFNLNSRDVAKIDMT